MKRSSKRVAAGLVALSMVPGMMPGDVGSVFNEGIALVKAQDSNKATANSDNFEVAPNGYTLKKTDVFETDAPNFGTGVNAEKMHTVYKKEGDNAWATSLPTTEGEYQLGVIYDEGDNTYNPITIDNPVTSESWKVTFVKLYKTHLGTANVRVKQYVSEPDNDTNPTPESFDALRVSENGDWLVVKDKRLVIDSDQALVLKNNENEYAVETNYLTTGATEETNTDPAYNYKYTINLQDSYTKIQGNSAFIMAKYEVGEDTDNKYRLVKFNGTEPYIDLRALPNGTPDISTIDQGSLNSSKVKQVIAEAGVKVDWISSISDSSLVILKGEAGEIVENSIVNINDNSNNNIVLFVDKEIEDNVIGTSPNHKKVTITDLDETNNAVTVYACNDAAMSEITNWTDENNPYKAGKIIKIGDKECVINKNTLGVIGCAENGDFAVYKKGTNDALTKIADSDDEFEIDYNGEYDIYTKYELLEDENYEDVIADKVAINDNGFKYKYTTKPMKGGKYKVFSEYSGVVAGNGSVLYIGKTVNEGRKGAELKLPERNVDGDTTYLYYGDKVDVDLVKIDAAYSKAIKVRQMYISDKQTQGTIVSEDKLVPGKDYYITALVDIYRDGKDDSTETKPDNDFTPYYLTKKVRYDKRPLDKCDVYLVDNGVISGAPITAQGGIFTIPETYSGSEYTKTFVVKNPGNGEELTTADCSGVVTLKGTNAGNYYTALLAVSSGNYKETAIVRLAVAKKTVASGTIKAEPKSNIIYDGEAVNKNDFNIAVASEDNTDAKAFLADSNTTITLENWKILVNNTNWEHDDGVSAGTKTCEVVFKNPNYEDYRVTIASDSVNKVVVKKRSVKITPASGQKMTYGDKEFNINGIVFSYENAIDINGDHKPDNTSGVIEKDAAKFNSATKPENRTLFVKPDKVKGTETEFIYNAESNSYADAGTYTYKLDGEWTSFDSNYSIVLNDTPVFTVVPKQLSKEMFTLNHGEFTYDKNEHSVAIGTAKDNDISKDLIPNTDYEVGGIESADSIGTYQVEVAGKGNYTGAVDLDWSIVENPDYVELDDSNIVVTNVCVKGADGWAMPNECVKVEIVKDGVTKVLTKGTDYKFVSSAKTRKNGEVTVKIQGQGNYSGYASAKVTVVESDFSNAYGFVKKESGVSVKPGTKDLYVKVGFEGVNKMSGFTVKNYGIIYNNDGSVTDASALTLEAAATNEKIVVREGKNALNIRDHSKGVIAVAYATIKDAFGNERVIYSDDIGGNTYVYTKVAPTKTQNNGKYYVKVGFSGDIQKSGCSVTEYGLIYCNKEDAASKTLTLETAEADENVVLKKNYTGLNIRDLGTGVKAVGYMKISISTGNEVVEAVVYTDDLGGKASLLS